MSAVDIELDIDLKSLALTEVNVARLGRAAREERVDHLVVEAQIIYGKSVETAVTGDNRRLAATAILFSGGNDSTVLAHMFRNIATHAAHANTGVGIEETRQFVRDTCAGWGLPLIEQHVPDVRDSYRNHVLTYGFPGAGAHYKIFQRIKERSLWAIRGQLVSNGRQERVVYLAGRRRTESKQRATIPVLQRDGSVVWVSPLVNWTKLDMNTYRITRGDVPRNRVSDLIHMSGECLCGSYAHEGEREEILAWFPLAFEEIEELEAILATYPDDYIPPGALKPLRPWTKVWGWNGDPMLAELATGRVGALCSSCAA